MTFSEKCYQLLRQVPSGKVTTYAEIARALNTKAYRAVGTAMNKNPYPKDEVPCHRVVKSNGLIGGYVSGRANKAARLRQEGIKLLPSWPGKEERVQDLNSVLHKFC